MNDNDEYIWLGVYLFFDGDIYGECGDQIILQYVDPIVGYAKQNKMTKKYFFIRYSEKGSHIRLRFFGQRIILETRLKPFIEDYVNNTDPTNSKTTDNYSRVNSIDWVNYEPEIDRYGGHEAVKIAEDLFQHSSEFCIEQIKHIKNGGQSTRFGRGIIEMIVYLNIFFEDRLSALSVIQNYGRNYLKGFAKEEHFKAWSEIFNEGFEKQSQTLVEYIDTFWEALDNNYDLPKNVASLVMNTKNVKRQLEHLFDDRKIVQYKSKIESWHLVLRSIVPSYIHMTNNRLGISIKDESYLSHLIAAAMQSSFIVK